MIYNNLTCTFPYVFHSPRASRGGDNDLLLKLKKKQDRIKPSFEKPDDLSVITFNNKDKPCILEECFNLVGLPHTVLGRGVDWKNKIKINLIFDFLVHCKTKYVLAVDGYDALIVRNLIDITDKFRATNQSLIFNATYYRWPPVGVTFRCDSLHKKSLECPFVHLNAGVWIGEVDYCLNFFNTALQQKHDFTEFEDSEQVLVKLAAELYSRYDIDYNFNFFQVWHGPHYGEDHVDNYMIKVLLKLL